MKNEEKREKAIELINEIAQVNSAEERDAIISKLGNLIEMEEDVKEIGVFLKQMTGNLPREGQPVLTAVEERICSQNVTIKRINGILDDIWAINYPKAEKGSWDIPSQVLNHFRAFIGEKNLAIHNLTGRLAVYETYIRTRLNVSNNTWEAWFETEGNRENSVFQTFLTGYATELEAVQALLEKASVLMYMEASETGYIKQGDSAEPIELKPASATRDEFAENEIF